MATLTFLGMANIAVRLVKEKYPESRLYEAEGTVPDGGRSTDPHAVANWTFVFSAGAEGTAFIRNTAWGEFGAVVYNKEDWGGCKPITWPISMDIVDADRLLKQAGYQGAYYGCSLRWPLDFRDTEPLYIFTMGDSVWIGVGTTTGKVAPIS